MIYLKKFERKNNFVIVREEENKNITCGELRQGCLDYLHYLEDIDPDFSWSIFCNTFSDDQKQKDNEPISWIEIDIQNNKYFTKDSISEILNILYDYLLRVDMQIPEWNDVKSVNHGKYYHLGLSSFHIEHGNVYPHKMR